MTIVHILNPDDVERDEIRKIKEVIDLCKEPIKKSPSKRAYIELIELDRLFPSKRSSDRFDESLMNNLKKYVSAYNKKYSTNGIYYHIGSILKDGKRICVIQEMERSKTNIGFSIIDEAEIDNRKIDEENIDTIGGVSRKDLET